MIIYKDPTSVKPNIELEYKFPHQYNLIYGFINRNCRLAKCWKIDAFNALTNNEILAANYPFATISSLILVQCRCQIRDWKFYQKIYGAEKNNSRHGGICRHRRAGRGRLQGRRFGNKFWPIFASAAPSFMW